MYVYFGAESLMGKASVDSCDQIIKRIKHDFVTQIAKFICIYCKLLHIFDVLPNNFSFLHVRQPPLPG